MKYKKIKFNQENVERTHPFTIMRTLVLGVLGVFVGFEFGMLILKAAMLGPVGVAALSISIGISIIVAGGAIMYINHNYELAKTELENQGKWLTSRKGQEFDPEMIQSTTVYVIKHDDGRKEISSVKPQNSTEKKTISGVSAVEKFAKAKNQIAYQEIKQSVVNLFQCGSGKPPVAENNPRSDFHYKKS